MPPTSRTRPKLGDLIEVPLSRGLAYAHYTHKHPQYGALLRVLEGIHETRPRSLEFLVGLPVQFMAFFPLGAACRRGLVRVVAAQEAQSATAPFPLFRAGVANSEGRVETWWLWDGSREWRADIPRAELQALPVRGVWNDTLLIQRIESGWRSTDVRVD